MESKVEIYTDKVWELVGKHFTLNDSQWPLWAAPLVHARQRAMYRYSPDASPAKPRKCDRCAARPEERPCVLREGAKNCDRCTVNKKGCRIDGESYSEWFDNAGFSRGKFTHSSCALGIF